MPFDVNRDFSIFDSLIKKRPELASDQFKKELESYYLPYIKRLVDLKNKKNSDEGVIVGVSAIQGAGKTTQGEVLEVLLKHLGYSSVSLSIDDHYITHKELCELRNIDPRYIRRGVTHDIPLAIRDLSSLQKMDHKPVIISGYDKGANHGDGERFAWVNLNHESSIKYQVLWENLFINKASQKVLVLKLINVVVNGLEVELPQRMGSDLPIIENLLPLELIEFLKNQEGQQITVTLSGNDDLKFSGTSEIVVPKKGLPNGWKVVSKKPDFIFYDGWMLGVRMADDVSFNMDLPALETGDYKDFARMINKRLENYQILWQMIGFLNVLYVPDYQISIKWRDQAEEILRQKGEGMTHKEIVEFVYYFWRSVHPAIHIRNLARDTLHTNQVTIINEDHSISEVLSPDKVI